MFAIQTTRFKPAFFHGLRMGTEKDIADKSKTSWTFPKNFIEGFVLVDDCLQKFW